MRNISVAMGSQKHAGDYGTPHYLWDNLWRKHQRWYAEIAIEQARKEFGGQSWWKSARLVEGPLRRITESKKFFETWKLLVCVNASAEEAAKSMGAKLEHDGWHWRILVVEFIQAESE